MKSEFRRTFLVDPGRVPQISRSLGNRNKYFISEDGDRSFHILETGTRTRLVYWNSSGISIGTWERVLSKKAFAELVGETVGNILACATESIPASRGLNLTLDLYGENLKGLAIAEFTAATAAEARNFTVPQWFGPEISFDFRYRDSALARGPRPPTLPFQEKAEVDISYGVLPFLSSRLGSGMVTISTRQGERWIFPKGQPEKGKTSEEVALNEAWEEAGLVGDVVGPPISLPYERFGKLSTLILFPLSVRSISDNWLEEKQRERKIIPFDEAVRERGLIAMGTEAIRALYV